MDEFESEYAQWCDEFHGPVTDEDINAMVADAYGLEAANDDHRPYRKAA